MRKYRYHRVMIVDGYNVIRSSCRYASLIDESQQTNDIYYQAREALISDVAAATLNSYDAIIVFDGGGNPYSDGASYKRAGVDIRFSPYKQEADAVIEKLATEAREAGCEVLVVTSDAATQWTVVGEGVSRQSSRMFLEDIESLRNSFEEDAVCYHKSTIGKRIDPQLAEKLRRMARGEL